MTFFKRGFQGMKEIVGASKKTIDDELKELKDSIFECEKVINQNKDRFPVLEKNHKLVLKQIKRINDDIQHTKESLEWYDNNTETVVTTTTTTEDAEGENK